jgi:lipopolysaccharide export system permease protein
VKPTLRRVQRYSRLSILDRYMLMELSGPFGFGLSAFTLIFAATSLLSIGRMVSTDHAPLWAAVEVFLWGLPQDMVFVLPMALLLGTLLTIQRLSGESEITAMKAGGIGFIRVTVPLLVAGLVMTVVMFLLQEFVTPFAADRVSDIEGTVLGQLSAFNRDLTVSAPLPGGGRQITVATSYDKNSQALLHVTLVQYDRKNVATQIIFADRADFTADKWVLQNASLYRFNPDGTLLNQPRVNDEEVELGEKPTDIAKRIGQNDLETMSRSQIRSVVASGQLTPMELRRYVTTYQEKLAQPFACFVFVLIAIPFGMRAARSGGGTGVGFGLAVLIVFVYYVVLTFFSYISVALPNFALLWAWMPNVLFTALGIIRLRRAATV